MQKKSGHGETSAMWSPQQTVSFQSTFLEVCVSDGPFTTIECRWKIGARAGAPDSRPETRKSHAESPNNSVEKWGCFSKKIEGPYLRKGGMGGSRDGHTGSLGKLIAHPESFIRIVKFFQLNEGR